MADKIKTLKQADPTVGKEETKEDKLQKNSSERTQAITKKRTARLNLRMSEVMFDNLGIVCQEKGIDMPTCVKLLISNYIDENRDLLDSKK